jgi:hypothetical protein
MMEFVLLHIIKYLFARNVLYHPWIMYPVLLSTNGGGNRLNIPIKPLRKHS